MAMTFYPHSHFPGPHHSALWPRVVIYPTPMHGMLSYHARMHVCIRDGLNAVFSGVLRGSGQQLTGAAVSGSCFLFSLPTTYYLAFIADWSMLSGVPILGALEPVCLRVIHPPTQCPSRSSKVSASILLCITEHNKNSFIGCPPLIIHLPQGGTSLAGSLCRFDASVLRFAGGHVTLGLE